MLRQIIEKLLRKDVYLCVLSAFLLALSFSFSQCWIFAWFAFVPLFLATRGKNRFQVFTFFYIAGLIFWSITVYWLIHVTLLGQIILIAYLAFYFGFFGLLLSFSYILPTKYYIFFVSSLWVILEYLRSHLLTGFPWALLGYSQYANLPVIQVADIAGTWIVSFLVMMVNAAIYLSIVKKIRFLLLPILCLAVTLTYGYYKLYLPTADGQRSTAKISVIQGNIPQELKWHSASREFVMERYFKLTDEAKIDAPDLIIWPEASLPVILEEEPLFFERLSHYVRATGIPLLFGAVTGSGGLYYNSALLLSKEGKISQKYHKLHLVPFGEYIPFRDTLTFLETIVPIGDITAGVDYSIFDIQPQTLKIPEVQAIKYNFGILICFEDIFPELARRFVNKGADFLVNITNDAWFGKTSEAYQHLAASVFRAVENRVYLVRSANTGVSGFINPQGRIESLVKDRRENPIFTAGYATQEISPHREPTFYGRYGDFLIAICSLYFLYSVLFTLSKKSKVKSQKYK